MTSDEHGPTCPGAASACLEDLRRSGWRLVNAVCRIQARGSTSPALTDDLTGVTAEESDDW